MEYRELLIGCGYARDKRIVVPGATPKWCNLTTLDSNPSCNPDIVCDLNAHKWISRNEVWEVFDEVHAYEVLEHLGRQWDVQSFFATFNNIYRLLKPGGYCAATVPSRYSDGLWGDPGHTRIINAMSLVFLSRQQYVDQRKARTSMSDYRDHMQCDFDIVRSDDDKTTHRFILQKVSPQRYA